MDFSNFEIDNCCDCDHQTNYRRRTTQRLFNTLEKESRFYKTNPGEEKHRMMHSAAAAVPRRVAGRFTIYPAAKRGLASGAAGNTLSGRSRFYKNVGIQSLEIPPWKSINSSSSKDDRVASPVSAGVDGTQSATGVHHIPQDTKTCSLEEFLTPRLPGQEFEADNNTKWYGITLDGRKVSTPMGQTLAVPSETLAYMIAAEWDNQRKDIQPSNMPLMTLACTALDQAAIHPQFYRDAALQYLPTDTVCIVQ